MANWTRPRLLANKKEWFSNALDYNGPCCYMLGTGGPRGGAIRWHYVGHAGNEGKRMGQYGYDGSHLSDTIADHLKRGWCLYYRAISCKSKKAAKTMETRFLLKFKFDWNDKLNRA